MDVARFNLSHGSREVHAEAIRTLREVAARQGKTVAIMLDTRGPEVRLRTFQGRPLELRPGEELEVALADYPPSPRAIAVPYLPFEGLEAGTSLLLDDGNLALEVLEPGREGLRCRVVRGGLLYDRKKVSFPGKSLPLPVLSEEDVEDIRFGVEWEADFLAVSFVRSARDVETVRALLQEAGGDQQVIAKIESREGVEHFPEILEAADGIMVARGDMGVEYPVEEVPILQKMIIARCNRVGKPVVTATQMLESMVHLPRPTRAEASDVANAILDGTDAVMLSAETALGSYPVEAARTMSRIAERIDEALDGGELPGKIPPEPKRTVPDAISHATCTTAHDLGAAAIVTATRSGQTARMVAKYRPRVPIIASTPEEKVARRLKIVWGVTPIVVPEARSTEELVADTFREAVARGLLSPGDLAVVAAGVPAGINMVKVERVPGG